MGMFCQDILRNVYTQSTKVEMQYFACHPKLYQVIKSQKTLPEKMFCQDILRNVYTQSTKVEMQYFACHPNLIK